jgi:hypothetical protein
MECVSFLQVKTVDASCALKIQLHMAAPTQ